MAPPSTLVVRLPLKPTTSTTNTLPGKAQSAAQARHLAATHGAAKGPGHSQATTTRHGPTPRGPHRSLSPAFFPLPTYRSPN